MRNVRGHARHRASYRRQHLRRCWFLQPLYLRTKRRKASSGFSATDESIRKQKGVDKMSTVINVLQTNIDGHEVRVELRKMPTMSERVNTKSRTYVYYPTETFCGEHPPYTLKGNDPANDKAWKVYNKKELAMMEKFMILTGMGDKNEWRFSRKAGCSCPCSPGWVRKNTWRMGWDYVIEVTLVNS